MYSSFYNMPRNNRFMYRNRNSFGFPRRNDDRLFGGFAVPFLLGGITGAALSNQPFFGPYPTNYYYNNFYPYPYPYYYPYY